MNKSFTLWLEFEQAEGGYPAAHDDPLCDFCNAQIVIGTSTYAVNIWTFAYVQRARLEGNGPNAEKPATYLLAPDLLVERLDRVTIAHAIQDLMDNGNLPEAWLVSVA